MAYRKREAVSGRYGSWTVLADNGRKATCQCDCGTIRDVYPRDLLIGQSTRCNACARQEIAKTVLKAVKTTHGKSKTTEFRIWTDMRRRCHDPRRPDFHRYGGRGIIVCERWRESFEAFLSDMGHRLDGTTLERRDNDGPYDPSNCYWATKTEQKRNTRQARIVTFEGEQITMAEASVRLGGTRNLVIQRLRQGWPLDRALSVRAK